MATALELEPTSPPCPALAFRRAFRVRGEWSLACPLAKLPRRICAGEAEAAELAARWLDSGLAVLWPTAPGGPALVPSETGRAQLGAWDESEPKRYGRAPTLFTDLGAEGDGEGPTPEEAIADRREGPAMATERADAALAGWKLAHEKRKRGERIPAHLDVVNRPPPPRYLLDLPGPWPPPGAEDGPCPVCRGEKLRWDTACGWCLNFGLDGVMARPTPAELKALRHYEPPADGLRGGLRGKGRN